MDSQKFQIDNEEGLRFQDLVMNTLWTNGIAVYYNHSREFQKRWGEGPVVEVKLDRRSSETGNFFIECFHSPNGDEAFIESGILINGPLFWAQGDFREFFLLARKHLSRFFGENNPTLIECRHTGDIPTKGFILPLGDVEKLAVARFAVAPDRPELF